ncbi:MAG: hypothetical protein ABIG61_09455 [Planctomycetota bacterium]
MRLLLEQVEPFAKSGIDFAFGMVIGAPEANSCSFTIRQVNVCAEVFLPVYSQFGRLACSGHHVSPYSISILNRSLIPDFHAEFTQKKQKKGELGEKSGKQKKEGETLGIANSFYAKVLQYNLRINRPENASGV